MAVELKNRWTIAIAAILILILAGTVKSCLGLENLWMHMGVSGSATDIKLMGLVFLKSMAVLGPILFSIWAAALLGSEFTLRTAKVRAAQEGWANVIRKKQVALLVGSVATIVLSVVIGTIVGGAIWSRLEAPTALAVSYSLPLAALTVCLGLMFYASVALTVTLVTKSTLVGALTGMLLPFAELKVSYWWLPRSTYGYLLARALPYYRYGFITTPPQGSPPPSTMAAIGAFAAAVIVVTVLPTLIAQRQEV